MATVSASRAGLMVFCACSVVRAVLAGRNLVVW